MSSTKRPLPRVKFTATLLRPAVKDTEKPANWLFVKLPVRASSKLPSRGRVSVEGTVNGKPIQATAEPDGEGGHWLALPLATCKAARVHAGDSTRLDIAVMEQEPEPSVPSDVQAALDTAPATARHAWAEITPRARQDWIHWITSGKRAETRASRITKACDMLAKGKRRPCCFDRSGMYDKSLSCPEVASPHQDTRGDQKPVKRRP